MAAVYILLETAFQGPLLTEVLDGGLLVDWATSLLVSLAIIGTAVLAGIYVPRLWHQGKWSRFKKSIAIASLTLSVSVILVMSLAISYIRSGNFSPKLSNLSNFWYGDVLPANLEALSLMIFGQVIALFTYWKFSNLHDPVPDYQKLDRKHHQLILDLEKLDNCAPEELKQVASDSSTELHSFLGSVNAQCASFKDSLIDSKMSKEELLNGCTRIAFVHQQVIETRMINIKNISSKVPTFWNEGNVVVDIAVPEIFDFSQEEAALDRIKNQIGQLDALASQTEAKIEQFLR